MQEMGFGPNGALLFCMEYLLEDDSGWLAEQLEGYLEDDYLLLDCPGQIELYSHIPVFKRVAAMLQGYGFNVRAAARVGRPGDRRAQAAGQGALCAKAACRATCSRGGARGPRAPRTKGCPPPRTPARARSPYRAPTANHSPTLVGTRRCAPCTRWTRCS